MRKYLFFLALAGLIFFLSCQKELSDFEGPAPTDLTTKVRSSVSGFVTDENNLPVTGATVKAGNLVISTDKYGFFEIKNVDVVMNAATVTVTKSGYFNAIKTYRAENNKSAFFRIKLIPKLTSG